MVCTHIYISEGLKGTMYCRVHTVLYSMYTYFTPIYTMICSLRPPTHSVLGPKEIGNWELGIETQKKSLHVQYVYTVYICRECKYI